MDALPAPSRHSPSLLLRKSTAESLTLALGKKNYLIGIALLLVVVFLWTASNFVTQDLFDRGYEKPFLVTYLNTSAFSLYLLAFSIRTLWRRHRGPDGKDEDLRRGHREEYQPLTTDIDWNEDRINRMPIKRMPDTDPLTVLDTARLAFVFCFLWFVANWSVNASLDYTSVASATILSSMSGFFTLGIGRLFRVETLTVIKIGAVLASFGGVILVSVSDSNSSEPTGTSPSPSHTYHPTIAGHALQPLLGDALALLSATFYAFYVILLKVRVRTESRIDMQLFFGFVGLFNVLTCWPIGLLLHFIGVEKFELPSSNKEVVAILVNMAITLSSDYLYVLAMLKTTPLVVTVGLSLTIPLAVIGDFLLNKPTRGQALLGAVLVLISFIAVGVADSRLDDEVDMADERIRTQVLSGEGGLTPPE